MVRDPEGRKVRRRGDAAAVDRSLVATFRALSEGVEGALMRTIGRVPVAATMLPLAFFEYEALEDGARERDRGRAVDRRPRGVRGGPAGRMLGSLEDTDR